MTAYRVMNISDYAGIYALWQESPGVSLRDADSREGIDKYLQRNPGLSFVAMQDARIVGTIMAGHDARRGYIQHLAVARDLRKSGVGSRLVEHCLAALKDQGILKSHVHVHAENESARQFWLNRGWFGRSEIRMYSFINTDQGNP